MLISSSFELRNMQNAISQTCWYINIPKSNRIFKGIYVPSTEEEKLELRNEVENFSNGEVSAATA